MGCWVLYSHQSPAPEAPLAPGYTAAAASQRTGKDDPVSDRLDPPTLPLISGGLAEEEHDHSHIAWRPHQGDSTTLIPSSQSQDPPSTPSKPVHSTILASVLISARTQSGQSRSPQNRNLCKRVRWEVSLQEGLRCVQDPCSGRALSDHLFSLSPDCSWVLFSPCPHGHLTLF